MHSFCSILQHTDIRSLALAIQRSESSFVFHQHPLWVIFTDSLVNPTMKFSPAAAASLVAFFAASATAVPITRAEPAPVNFYQASGMTEMKDGSYLLTYDDMGTPRITFTPPGEAAPAARSWHPPNSTTGAAALSERAEGCDGFTLRQEATDSANADLQASCGAGYYGTIWSVPLRASPPYEGAARTWGLVWRMLRDRWNACGIAELFLTLLRWGLSSARPRHSMSTYL